jgi:hypothetical protein
VAERPRHAPHEGRAGDLPRLERGGRRGLPYLDPDGVRRLLEQEVVRRQQRGVLLSRHGVRDVELQLGWRTHDNTRIACRGARRRPGKVMMLPLAACRGELRLATT